MSSTTHSTSYNIAVKRLAMPARIRRLPVDERGYPVPRFVRWIDGVADFRVVDPDFLRRCIRFKRCWICGEPLGKHMAFVIGPMCAVNRVSAEPPSHLECAEFAIKACPFLTQPNRKRNEHDLPQATQNPAGLMIARNPGVSLLWVTTDYRTFKANGGTLITIGEPTRLEFYAKGRKATHNEIMQAINSGLPLLRQVAQAEGTDAMVAFERAVERAMSLVPAE